MFILFYVSRGFIISVCHCGHRTLKTWDTRKQTLGTRMKRETVQITPVRCCIWWHDDVPCCACVFILWWWLKGQNCAPYLLHRNNKGPTCYSFWVLGNRISKIPFPGLTHFLWYMGSNCAIHSLRKPWNFTGPMSQRGPDRTSLWQVRFDSTLKATRASYRRDEEQQLTDYRNLLRQKRKKINKWRFYI